MIIIDIGCFAFLSFSEYQSSIDEFHILPLFYWEQSKYNKGTLQYNFETHLNKQDVPKVDENFFNIQFLLDLVHFFRNTLHTKEIRPFFFLVLKQSLCNLTEDYCVWLLYWIIRLSQPLVLCIIYDEYYWIIGIFL